MPAVDGDAKGKRNLVRWDDDKDKQLLLTLQYVCANAGIRIPWDDVAKEMGPKFSGGACVQHLAKLRSRMEEEGIEVPPPLARGLVTSKPSSIYAKAGGGRKRRAPAAEGEAEDSTEFHPLVTPPPSKKRKSIKKEPGIKEESEGEMPELYDDDDDDYMASSKKANKVTKPKPKAKTKKPTKKNNARSLSEEAISAAEKTPTPETPSPVMRTRGNRVNYAQMDVPIVEEEEVAVEGPTTGDNSSEAQLSNVKTEETNNIPPSSGIVVCQPPTPLTPKEEACEPVPRQQQMQAPAPYYHDFGGNYSSFPGFNPSLSFGQPNGQTMWGQPNFGMPTQQFMYGGQSQQQEKNDAKVVDWLSESIAQPQPIHTQNVNNQVFNPIGGFDANFVDTMFSPQAYATNTNPAFKKTSVSNLKSADTSRNNSHDSINTQDTLKAVPQPSVQGPFNEAFNNPLDDPIPNSFADLIDWDAIERDNAQYEAQNGY